MRGEVLGLAALTIASDHRVRNLPPASIALLCFCALILAAGPFSIVPRYSIAAGVLFFRLSSATFSIARTGGVDYAFRVIGYAMLALVFASLTQALFDPAQAWWGSRFRGFFGIRWISVRPCGYSPYVPPTMRAFRRPPVCAAP